VLDLATKGADAPLRDLVETKFPTAAIAELELSIENWSKLDRDLGKLSRFTRPRDLDPAMGPQDE
jgi:phosphohistidine phosphatase